jgi:guanylate cyclase
MTWFRRVNQKIEQLLCAEEDADGVRARKITTFWALVLSVVFPLSWLSLYRLYDLDLAFRFQLIVVGISLVEFFIYLRFKHQPLAIHLAMMRLFVVLGAHHVFLGGFFQSGVALASLILSPLVSSILLDRRSTVVYGVLYILIVLAALVFEPALAENAPHIPASFSLTNLVMSLIANGIFILGIVLYLVSHLDAARDRADQLLLNILPAPIAAHLKRSPGTIARYYDEAGILFADIVGFTPLSAELTPVELVDELNRIYSQFDRLADQLGVEKMTTIGDSYMAAAGLPEPQKDFLDRLARMALDMLAIVDALPEIRGRKLALRIGIHGGPLVAGVIGERKFQYDVWGDTVNTASRMEAHGVPGKIQVSRPVFEQLTTAFDFEARGAIDVKGKGQMNTWFLLRERV